MDDDRAADRASDPSERHERFDLSAGRTLIIRPTDADDADRLESLYRSLDSDDLRRRFFTAWSPQGDWCRSWAAVRERGGFGVIAVEVDSGAAESIVGEAGYARRHDDDGELAVAVRPDWRGWLGPYLVERLVEHAAHSNVANLQADVLLENKPMRRLLEHRGAVVFGHDGATEHVSISTGAHVPSWPERDSRRRLLVEAAGGRWRGESAADDADVAIAVCTGPARRTRHGCPVLAGARCPLADQADAILVLLDPADDDTMRVVESHSTHNPATPVFVRRSEAVPTPCRVLSGDADADIAAVLGAATESTQRASTG